MKKKTALVLAWIIALTLVLSGNPSPALAQTPASAPTPAQVKELLDTTARTHLERVARTLRPNREHVATDKQQDGQVVAWYQAVDISSLRTELLDPRNTGGVYIGNVIYVIHEYRSIGPTGQQVPQNEFHKVKSRRIREYAQFVNGAWRL
jgi:hypothetical protein